MEKRRSPRSSPAILPQSPLVYEKYKSGCASGLIGFFNFRQGRSSRKKLITNKANACKHTQGVEDTKRQLDLLPRFEDKGQLIDDVVGDKYVRVQSSNANEKRKIFNAKEQQVESDPKPVRESSKRQTGTSKRTTKPHERPVHDWGKVATLGHRQSSKQNLVEKSPNEFDFGKTIDEKVGLKKERERSCKSIGHLKKHELTEIDVQVHVNGAAEALMNQEHEKGKGFSRDGGSSGSKHFLDALEILSSNKELFIKLLQDPSSLMVKRIQDLQASQPENGPAESYLETRCLENQMKGSEELEDLDRRIVLLKPGSTSMRFKHMKQKLKRALGVNRDELHLPQADNMMEKLYSVQRSKDSGEGKEMEIAQGTSPNRKCIDPRLTYKSFPEIKKTKRTSDGENSQLGFESAASSTSRRGHRGSESPVFEHKKEFESSLHMESARHVFSKLTQRHEMNSRRRMMDKLERISSLPIENFLLASTSPGKEREEGNVTRQMRYSPYSCSSTIQNEMQKSPRENVGDLLEAKNHKFGDHSERSYAIPNVSKRFPPDTREHGGMYFRADESARGLDKIVEATSSVTSAEIDTIHIANGCREDVHMDCSSSGIVEDSSSGNCTPISEVIPYSSSGLSPQREDTNSMKLEKEHPSPVSVLERVHMEDTTATPESIKPPSAEQICVDKHSNAISDFCYDLKINLTEAVQQESLHEYVKTVLEASCLDWTDLLTKGSLSPDRLLDPASFRQPLGTEHDDHGLVFDYINEVLRVVYEFYIKCSPWTSPVSRKLLPFTFKNDRIQEAMKHFDWNCFSEPPEAPRTLDQLVEKDLSKGKWMDVRGDTDDIVAGMVECIMEELETEIAVDLQS